MRVLMMSIGTRGDAEPFLGVGAMLQNRGVTVDYAFCEQHRGLVEETGGTFHSMGSDFLDLLDSPAGRAALGSGRGGWDKVRGTLRVSQRSLPIQRDMIDRQHEIVASVRPDAIVFHPKVTYPIPWTLATGKRSVLLSPVPRSLHRVEGTSNVGINVNLGPLNPLTYSLATYGTSVAVMMAAKQYFPGQFTRRQISRRLLTMPVAYAVSSTLFPRPAAWPDNAIVAGFWERDQATAFTPDASLRSFVETHERVLLATFGSMVNTDPAGTTERLVSALDRLRQPAILNLAGGGLTVPGSYDPDLVHVTDAVPYDWLFPRVHAVVHHGGAGTTQSALQAGCASLVVPHAADQPIWANLVHDSGAGPRGIPFSKLTEDGLTGRIHDLVSNPGYKRAAERIADGMAHEDHADQLYRFILSEPVPT